MKIFTFPRSTVHMETVLSARKTREEALTAKELKELEKQSKEANGELEKPEAKTQTSKEKQASPKTKEKGETV